MRFGRIFQLESLADFDLDVAAVDDIEQVCRTGHQIVAFRGIDEQRRPGDVERTLCRQDAEIERRHRT